MKLTILLAAVLASMSSLHAATLLEGFQFNDAAGTDLDATANSGTSGNSWNFKFGTTPEGAGDGSSFVLGADATAGSGAMTKDWTRKVEFSTTLTGATYSDYVFEVAVTELDLTGSAGDGTAGELEGISFKLNTSGNDTLSMSIDLGGTDALRSRHSVSGGALTGTTATKSFGSGANSTTNGVVLKIEGNLQTGAFETFWRRETGASSTYTSLMTGGGLTSIQDILLGVNADTGWGATDNMKLDFLTLEATAVPEPSSAALLGLGGLALILRRKK